MIAVRGLHAEAAPHAPGEPLAVHQSGHAVTTALDPLLVKFDADPWATVDPFIGFMHPPEAQALVLARPFPRLSLPAPPSW